MNYFRRKIRPCLFCCCAFCRVVVLVVVLVVVVVVVVVVMFWSQQVEFVCYLTMSYPLNSLCLTLSVMTSSVAAIGSASMERPPVGSSSFSSPCAAREVSPTIALGVIQEAKRFVAEKEKEFGPAAYGGTIDVYWNTIKSSSGLGYLSTSTIQKQIQDINNAFAPGSWRFNLASVRTYTNDDWFYNIRYGDDEPMKRSLYRGDSHNLNIYSMQLADDVLGWATFPWDFEENTYTDGVVLGYNTLAVSELKLS
jgi:hypothetical protein